MRTPLRVLLPALVLCSLALPGAGRAIGGVTFTKVLDSETPVPGESGTFGAIHGLNDGSPPGRRLLYAEPHIAMDADGNLAFGAGNRMFAIIDGQLHVVAQLEGDTGQVSIQEGRVTFGVIDLGGNRVGGIFRWEPDGALFEIAGAHTQPPESGEECVFWTKENGVSNWPFSVDGDAILVSSGRSGEGGTPCGGGNFLWRNGALERVGDLVPQLNRPSIKTGLIAFVGWDGAIHAQELGQPPTRLVGPGDTIPGRSGVLSAVRDPQVSAGRVAFEGRKGSATAGRWGAYLWQGGTLSLLVEEGMQLPEGRRLDVLSQRSGAIQSPLRLGADRFAVVGADDQGAFLYLASLDGTWERVIDPSDGPSIDRDGLGEFDGRQLVIEGNGVYVARADGSLLKIHGPGDELDGRRAGGIQPGDLQGDRLTLGFGSPTGHVYVAELPPIPVEIHVRPHRATNRLHARSRRSIPLAVLGSETFPVKDMDVTSIEIGPNVAPARGKPKLRDVNGDGWTDLVLRFRPRDSGIEGDDSEVCLSGETRDGIGFEGCDAVTLLR